ncbi:MAG TPA: manganese efflux pump MntP family protein [Azospirillum sp.]|nr:manganese efflux pump MntP family protein [Azospirillum sp.]
MSYATTLILAFSLSMDSFAAALGTGAVLRRPSLAEALRVGFLFGGVQLAMPLIGFALGLTFATYVQAVDHWIAFLLLLGVGGKMLWGSVSDEGDDTPAGRLALGQLFLMAVATSVDAAAVGVSLAVVDVDIVGVCLLIGLVTFGMASSGVLMGRAAGPLFGKRAELIGGLGLIAIGVKILVEHTM